MTRIAVTGHRNLSPRTTVLIDTAVREALRPYAPDIVGISCLASGADQIFASAVIDLGGVLEAVVPARQYGEASFRELLARAVTVRRLPYDLPSPAAYAAANEVMLASADVLVAIWDGLPAQGIGGTAEAVADAVRREMPVHIVWPPGAARLDTT
ncbi:hypothetical protein [Microtetraspora glauca]|uniref:DUF2493 domain-containing protein n=1 Tax=Microtetraspora glauca TaxID=1996 RepID=A0ABV3GBT5_MICGL